MADLQDELHATAEVGELDQPAPPPVALPEPDEHPDVGLGSALDLSPLSDPDAGPLDRAHAILAAHPVADGYSGLPWALRHLLWYDLELGESSIDTDVPRMRRGHVGALFWALHLPEGLTGDRAVGATLEQLDLVRTVARSHPEGLRLAGTAGQVTDARNCGRVAVVLGPASAAALDDSIGILRVLHSLGLRLLTLAGTSWASKAGLSRFGEEVVREMNRHRRTRPTSRVPPPADHQPRRHDLQGARSCAPAPRPAPCAPTPPTSPTTTLAELGAAGGLCLVPLTAEQTGPVRPRRRRPSRPCPCDRGSGVRRPVRHL